MAEHVVAVPSGRLLTGHTAAARKALLHELRRHGTTAPISSVSVFRRLGHLELELHAGIAMSPTQAELLAAHVANAVRNYDRSGAELVVLIRGADRHDADALTTAS